MTIRNVSTGETSRVLEDDDFDVDIRISDRRAEGNENVSDVTCVTCTCVERACPETCTCVNNC
jgi:hypothetical protein